ncbi:MAG TPA: DUF4097 family beta strand repeat-containing protein [Egicoccus sp.]|nr:DUF4097 family beta strand repeat-containing protein [Egicoccus sp.]HSK23009.1 DUF4097 family beta strand repeat-containing protein [Egicoccus sp.]
MTAFDLSGPTAVHVELSVGSVHVIATDRADAEVTVTPADPGDERDVRAARAATAELVDGRLEIRGPRPRIPILEPLIGPRQRAGYISVVIEAPEDSDLDIRADAADVRADGRFGEVRAGTGVGNIRIDHSRALRAETSGGDVLIEQVDGNATVTGGGEIRIGRIDGTAEVQNINGPITIGEVTGRLKAKSANGDVTVGHAAADVTALTASGRVRVGEVVRGNVSLKSGAGAIEVGIRDGTAAWVDARSKFGRVHNDLEAADGPGVGTDTAEIRILTGTGDIHIRRA